MLKPLENQSEKLADLEAENSHLKQRIRLLEKALFGPKSERSVNLDENQGEFEDLLNELDDLSAKLDEKEIEVSSHKKRKKKSNLADLIPDDLPEEEIIVDLSEEEKEGLIQIGEERSRKLAKKPASYYVKVYVRPKYADKKDSSSGILISDLPDFAIPGSQFDESIIADVAVSKHAYHLPLYRLEEKMKHEGIPVSRQTLSNLLIRGSEVLVPVYNELKKQILSRGVIFTDDTPVKLQVKGKGKKGLITGRIWVYVAGGPGPPMKVFEFTKDRQKIRPKEFLGDYKGYIHADAYSGYDALFKSDDVYECACWMHVRRKFIEAEDAPVAFRQEILRLIRNLYRYERIGKRMTPENRLQLRQEKVKPLINEFFQYIEDEMINGPIILPKSGIGKALNYTIKLKDVLKTFLEDSRLEPDNGESERSLRPMTIGRKNWLFMGSKNGGDATARWASIIQTCRANDVDPFEYISETLRKINGHPANKIEELLPHNFKR
jgi:transposase